MSVKYRRRISAAEGTVMAHYDTKETLFLIEQLGVKDLPDECFDAKSFPELLSEFMKKHNVNVPQLSEMIILSRSFVYQICEGIRAPGRDVVLRIAVALKLNLDDSQRLLRSAQRGALYAKVRRDAVIIFALKKHMTLDETDEMLRSLEEEPLL